MNHFLIHNKIYNKGRRKCIKYFHQTRVSIVWWVFDENSNVWWNRIFHLHYPSNRFHQTFEFFNSPFILQFKIADLATLVLLNELMDSDDEKLHQGKTRSWIKRRRDREYFNNIIRELRIEDRFGFREMFRMDVTDFEYAFWLQVKPSNLWSFECQKRSKDTPSFMFCTQRSDKIQTVWWNSTQMHQTYKSGLIKEDLFDEKFAREQTSSKNYKHDFFLPF